MQQQPNRRCLPELEPDAPRSWLEFGIEGHTRFAEGVKQHQQQRFLTALVHRELSVLSPSTRLALAHFVLQCAEGESFGAQASVSHVLQRLPAAVMGLLQGGGPLRQILQRPYFR